jgi:multidrug resistance efflux pump
MNAFSLNWLFARFRGWPTWRWVLLGILLVVFIGFLYGRGNRSATEIASFTVRRGPLDITVMEGGSVRAVDSQEIKCEVRVGYQGLKILKIVDEGYEVTSEDIRTNKVLVELDSSDLKKQIVQQDIQYETALANLTDAQQNYEIQMNQNLSDIKAAEQKVRFARMDFDKFLGDSVTESIIAELGIEKELATEESNANAKVAAVTASTPGASQNMEEATPANGNGKPATNSATPATTTVVLGDSPDVVTGVQGSPPGSSPKAEVALSGASDAPSQQEPHTPPSLPTSETQTTNHAFDLDFTKYADINVLGDGEAKQKLRKFQDDLQVARKEEGQAKVTLEGTKRLFEKGFVTRIDLERDEIAAENNRLKVQTAATARDLFIKYEFPKSAEESLSKYAETARELARARKAAISKLAQAQARLKSAQGQYNIQSRQRKEYYEQLDKCTIKAEKPGLVVYGRGGDEMVFYGGEERIREGATVRERQSIITIPDMTKMSVRVKIHETYIKKVKKGQKAKITVDAYPDKVLDGEVTSVGVLPDSQNMWMNPDMKVYLTTVTLVGTNEWLKPGMSAKVEIMVNRLENVLYAPVQAVSAFQGKQVCYLQGSRGERRTVEVGEFNDEFIEIKSGLNEGDRVLLRPLEAPVAEEPRVKPEETAPKGSPAPQPAAA